MKLCFLLITSCLFAEIRDIFHISEFRDSYDKGALVIFDIDNTIMESAQTLGSDQWFTHRCAHYANRGYSSEMALDNALAEWMSIQNLTTVQLVEPEVVDVIEEMQTSGYPLIGLTTRGMGMALRTIEQLRSLQIDLSKSSPFQEEKHFVTQRGVIFREGILFTAGTHKGEAFYKLFQENLPSKVIFINDKRTHLKEVETTCEKLGIPFLGLRYGFLDKKVQNYSPEIAAIQWEHFGKLISDSEAEGCLLKR